MARTRTIRRAPKRRNTKNKQSLLMKFLPESLQAFIARRFVDGFALTSILGGLFILLALLSYNPADPSWNTAAGTTDNTTIANWMGTSGAWLSDLLLQTLGIGSALFSLVLISWGIRSFNRQSLRPIWLRSIALCAAALFTAIAFAQNASEGWGPHTYLGGAFGTLILNKIGLSGQGLSALAGPTSITTVAGLIALPLALYASATKLAEIGYIFQKTWNLIKHAALFIIGLVYSFQQWIAHHNDTDYRPDPLAAIKALPFKIPAHTPVRIAPQITTGATQPVQAPAPAPQSALPTAAKPSAPIPVVTPQTSGTQPTPSPQQRFSLSDIEDWELPGLELLQTPPSDEYGPQLNENALRRNAELLQNVLADFNIEGEITSIHPGPVVTLYELEPAPGTKSAKVISLADDIARSMSAISVRVAVVPGRNVIGIELPNKNRQIVYMQDLLTTALYDKSNASLPLALGKDIGGQPIVADLAKMPHLLVAGTTGSGKSVAVNTMILSLLYRLPPEKCRFIMIDPKMLELSVYDGIPHLLAPVVTEPGKAVVALKWTVAEMEERYRAMSKLGVRNIAGYNERVREAARKGETLMQKVQTGFEADTGKPIFEDRSMDLSELPYIVVIVDEFADLMLVAGKDVESAIQRLAQMARAAGIHLIMATQRPSVDVITGVIKANFPTRISFQVTSKVDSRTILGEGGAEQLLGMGDMLYMAPGGRITRVHGPFVSDDEVESVVGDLKSKAAPSYIDSITDNDFSDASEVMQAIFDDRMGGGEKVDELYDEAVALVAREGKASTSFIQRYLQIGYNRAARIIEEMERQGVVSKANATGKREVLISDFSDVG
ncbi:MAG: DNA translocase FtsK 4TM domain-containing protein [Rhodospirillales bacterium]|nr:DNA translocase FtsK 4TM domain-containing protein [Rhodospirillales bacterium]